MLLHLTISAVYLKLYSFYFQLILSSLFLFIFFKFNLLNYHICFLISIIIRTTMNIFVKEYYILLLYQNYHKFFIILNFIIILFTYIYILNHLFKS